MTQILICPGIYNSSEQHWQTLWEQAHPQFTRVQQRDWDYPLCQEWVSTLEQAVQHAGSDTIIVAHSLGCLNVVHWAAQTKLAIKGALLVAVPDPQGANFPNDAKGFNPLPTQAFSFPSIMVYSTNDPYSTPEFTQTMASHWGCQHLVNLGDKGHINASSGLGTWPEGLSLLDKLLNT
ncbi:RBBP9/YdeN family alpha/beta hydrolase [Thiolinea disciformis]|uniref:RBBP9/YdeN family alpha/beta hydrolase n=1 Tax=Thiolinea disciformis TaxID=125614 RepID=UPI00035E6ADB|nr:alpha/beta hydrolase [Thiolinea disciformis]